MQQKGFYELLPLFVKIVSWKSLIVKSFKEKMEYAYASAKKSTYIVQTCPFKKLEMGLKKACY